MEIPDSCKYICRQEHLLLIKSCVQSQPKPLKSRWLRNRTDCYRESERQRQQDLATPDFSNYTRPSIEIVYGVRNNDFGITCEQQESQCDIHR